MKTYTKGLTYFVFLFLVMTYGYSATLSIAEPQELIDLIGKEQIDHSLAKFGNIPYGSNIMGQLYYPEPHDGCTPFDNTGIYFSFEKESNPANNPIILVDRGSCVLTTKTKYAQLIGAKMVLIVDNKDEDVKKLSFADNGLGKYLHIPTFIISKSAGTIIRDYLSKGSNNQSNSTNQSSIMIQANFPESPNVFQLDFKIWYTPSDKASMKFLKDWKSYHLALEPYLRFTPHVVLWYCTFCKALNWEVTDEIDCYSGGRYCAPDPDNMGPATGRQVVLEDLRELCIWNERSTEEFWDYVTSLVDVCGESFTMEDDCHQKVYDHLKWSDQVQKEVEDCIGKGFTGPNHFADDNSVLFDERDAYIKDGVQYWPSVYIDDKLQNEHDPDSLLATICDKLASPPEICTKEKESVVINENPYNNNNNEQIDWKAMLLIIFVSFIVLTCGIFLYRRSLKREMLRDMNNQVSTMITQYYALNDGGKRKDNL